MPAITRRSLRHLAPAHYVTPSGVTSPEMTEQSVLARTWARRLATTLALTFLAFPAHAEYPDRPLKIIVAWPPGGVIDIMARFIGRQLSEELGQAVVVEDLVGANGITGTTRVAKSPADGYMLQAITAESHAINPHLYKALPYDVFRDFAPVALFGRSNFVLATKASLAPDDVRAFVALAKAAPGRISMASYGVGSTSHLTMAALEDATGTSFLHVPYRGVAPIVNALLTQEIDAAFVTPHILVGLRKDGKVKILGAASLQRMALVPDVPTFTEQGLDGFVGGNWYGIVAPRGIPQPVQAKLASALQKIAASPSFQQQAKILGIEADYLDPAQFSEFLATENQRLGGLIKARHIEVP
jgi:tripartite-type tricarboxylate transporter receptor subunit TctC